MKPQALSTIPNIRQAVTTTLMVIGLGLFVFIGNKALSQITDKQAIEGRKHSFPTLATSSPVVSTSLQAPLSEKALTQLNATPSHPPSATAHSLAVFPSIPPKNQSTSSPLLETKHKLLDKEKVVSTENE
ncbi:MAG: hypothetical protein NVSMB46_03020 [Candidatus Saccharimonadales bacterium]